MKTLFLTIPTVMVFFGLVFHIIGRENVGHSLWAAVAVMIGYIALVAAARRDTRLHEHRHEEEEGRHDK